MNIIATLITHSLLNNPEDWEVDMYCLTNDKLKASVWDSGGYPSLHIYVPGIKVGGIAPFAFLVPWRRQVMAAVRQLRRQRETVAYVRGVKALSDAVGIK